MKYCTIEHCNRPVHGKGLCSYHYNKARMTPTYIAFHQSKNRCNNPNNLRYKDYGGRGIKMCDRWNGVNGYRNFIEDMGERPSGMTLDRVDNEKGYSPDNCRWATYEQQSLNKRVYISNRSGHRGVYKHLNRYWVASLRYKGKVILCKYCKTEQEAIKARLEAELDREKMLKTITA
jgi:hypothetical protein